MFDLVVRNGTVVTPSGVIDVDIGISDGVIAALEKAGLRGRDVLDASGKYVLPGCIDSHVHLQPGTSDPSIIQQSDDFESGSIAAACGGVTTFVDFAVQEQADGSALEVFERYRTIANETACIDFALHAGLTRPSAETLAEIPVLVSAGAASFKFFRTYKKWGVYTDLGFIYEAFAQIARHGAAASVHCEQDEILTHLRDKFLTMGLEHDLTYHARSRPDVAEEIAIEEVAALSRAWGTQAHVMHLSSSRGLDAVRRAKKSGARLRCEAGLHFLFFDSSVLTRSDAPLFFMTPPFRSPQDIDALWSGLADGSIDWVATDHSAHTSGEKERDPRFGLSQDGSEFAIPPGFCGMEEMLPLLFTYGVATDRLSLNRMVELLSTAPAANLNLATKGAIEVGKDADLVVYDPEGERHLTISELHTHCDYTIYEDMMVKGCVDTTMVRGDVVVRDGRFVGRCGYGQFVPAMRRDG